MARQGRRSSEQSTDSDHSGVRSWLFENSVGRLVVACVALLAFSELAVRYIEPSMPSLGLSEPAIKAGDLDALAHRGELDTVVVGASDAEAAIDPQTLEHAYPKPGVVYNASLKGMVPSTYARWVKDVVVDAHTPRRVVISFAPYMLLSPDLIAVGSAQETQAATVNHAISGQTIFGRLLNHSALARRRSILRNPVGVVEAAIRRANGQLAPEINSDVQRGHIRPDGWDTSYRTSGRTEDLEAGIEAAKNSSESVGSALRQAKPSASTMRSNAAGLMSLVTALRGSGADVTVVVLPFPRWIPDVFGDLSAAIDIERGVVEDAVGTFVDLSGMTIPLADYSDVNHVGPIGAKSISEALGAKMREQGE